MAQGSSRAALQAAATRAHDSWRPLLQAFLSSEIGGRLAQFLDQRLQAGATVFPAPERMFQALLQTPLSAVRVVVVGQDPYHGEDWVAPSSEGSQQGAQPLLVPQAQGLAFSVPRRMRPPPSLRNVLKEALGAARLQAVLSADASTKSQMYTQSKQNTKRNRAAADTREDLFQLLEASNLEQVTQPQLSPQPHPGEGWLDPWAAQGVLLLNTSLSVERGKAGSHSGKFTDFAWEALTDTLLEAVALRPEPCVYLLWGAYAQAKRGLIEAAISHAEATSRLANLGCVLTANHPSPLSALRPPQPFIGCAHFEQTNHFLLQHGLPAIDWQV